MNKENPAISICITMYNAVAYIGDCINSILCQTFRDFEIVVVDDGSTDGSRRVVESFTDCRIRLVESTHDYISSLNTALRLALYEGLAGQAVWHGLFGRWKGSPCRHRV